MSATAKTADTPKDVSESGTATALPSQAAPLPPSSAIATKTPRRSFPMYVTIMVS